MRWSRFSGQRGGSRWAALLVALILTFSLPGNALAHVGVNPNRVAVNSFLTFTISVPTEKDEPTVQLRVEFPPELIVSRFQPKPGWQRADERNAQGRISAATWSGGSIGPNEYEEFTFLARTPREPGKLVFNSYQTYQSGATVAWINAEDQDDPAPVVEVVADATTTETVVASVEEPSASAVASAPSITSAPIQAPTATNAVTTNTATTPPATPTETSTSVATAPPPVTTAIGSTATAGPSENSDIPLFASLGALGLALTALILAGVALARSRG